MLAVIILTIIGNISIGVLVLFNNRKSATNILLASLTLVVSLWTLFNYLALSLADSASQLFYVRMVMAVTTPFGPLIYLLAKTFPDKKIGISQRRLLIIIIFNLVIASMCLTDLVFSNIIKTADSDFNLVPGMGIIFYATNFLGFMTAGFYVLIRKHRHARGLEHEQLSFLLYGLIASCLLLTLTNFIAVVIFGSISLTSLGPPLTLIFVGATAYAIVKHNLFDIRLLVVRSIVYSLLTILLALLYSTVIIALQLVIARDAFRLDLVEFSIFLLVALVVAFSFQPIKKYFQKITNSFFYKHNYDPTVVLQRLTLIMASTIDLEQLGPQLVAELKQSVYVSSVRILIDDEKKGQIYSFPVAASNDHFTIHSFKLLSKSTIVEYDDLKEGELKQFFRTHDIRMIAHLKENQKSIGFVCLGEKLSGETFTETDKSLLAIFASEASVAIQNARAYQEIRQFNITLKEEVTRATSKLRTANERLLELDKLKDEFVSLASHELRTPMVSIRNYIWMVLNGKGGKVNPKQREYLRRAYDSTSRLSRLVNSMLNLSRIESGRVILSVEQADVRSVIREVMTEIGIRADKMGIKLTLRQKVESLKTGEAVQLPSVIIDIDKIKEVLINLIGNSLKFTPAGGSITVALSVDREHVLVEIVDSGIGLEADQIPKLFQKFSMLRESYSTNATMAQGTGLGLYICKSIIELHGGKIWVESEGHRKGSRFTFTLPRYSEQHLQLLRKNQHNGKDAGIIHSAVTDY